MASFKASTQKLAPIVFDSRQDSTLRVAQSVIGHVFGARRAVLWGMNFGVDGMLVNAKI
jgi:hypothetical protein